MPSRLNSKDEHHHPNAIQTDADKAFDGTKEVDTDGNV